MRGYAANSIEEYLAVVPADMGRALSSVRNILLRIIPDATERIGYQIPIFYYRGKNLVGISAAQRHCSLHLMDPALAKSLDGRLDEGTISGATLQFAPDAPLGETTLQLIVDRRMATVDEYRSR